MFCNEIFNKLNYTGLRILDSIYHMKLNYFQKSCFDMKTLGFCHRRDVVKSVVSKRYPNICKPVI